MVTLGLTPGASKLNLSNCLDQKVVPLCEKKMNHLVLNTDASRATGVYHLLSDGDAATLLSEL